MKESKDDAPDGASWAAMAIAKEDDIHVRVQYGNYDRKRMETRETDWVSSRKRKIAFPGIFFLILRTLHIAFRID